MPNYTQLRQNQIFVTPLSLILWSWQCSSMIDSIENRLISVYFMKFSGTLRRCSTLRHGHRFHNLETIFKRISPLTSCVCLTKNRSFDKFHPQIMFGLDTIKLFILQIVTLRHDIGAFFLVFVCFSMLYSMFQQLLYGLA